ncbi:MAG TPA: FAD-dependent oxidoreductase, partial [Segeticoccus sp.]|uniref:NAD(P)/FAD-dependent oxidoreductase n=1 Tax=Segeticoccus sp. TaxID=2706531 RepID=UPI002D80FBFC
MSTPPLPHVAVVGSGVAGASTAFALARRGVPVTVVDADRAGVATAAGAGIVQPWSSSSSGPYYELYAEGAAYYPTLLERLSSAGTAAVDFRRTGSLVVSPNPAELDEAEERIRRRTAGSDVAGTVERVDEAGARRLFPPLAPGLAALHVTGGARVDGRSLRQGLLQAAAARGARTVRGNATVTGGGTVQVDGEPLAADAVVLAAGAWTAELLQPVGVELGLAPQRGQITHLRLEGVDTSSWPSVLPLTGH